MAGDTPLCPYGSMLKGKGTCFIRMASETNLILGCGGAQLMGVESAVGIVAVATGNQAFIHLVMKRLGKVGFHFLVAGEAQCRLGIFQELMFHLRRVDGVTVNTTYVVFQMRLEDSSRERFLRLMISEALVDSEWALPGPWHASHPCHCGP